MNEVWDVRLCAEPPEVERHFSVVELFYNVVLLLVVFIVASFSCVWSMVRFLAMKRPN